MAKEKAAERAQALLEEMTLGEKMPLDGKERCRRATGDTPDIERI